ncbi:Ankyrin repeat-containing domain protein [Cordyceps fumosorosea ARSEF 2679]|uniref:Ankyrin repeat-containing domain protein n=1 Tax=Cordyceps fumosorosea (strain ARSEF 2679) TaxID=1081104 RepID=A0A162MJZ4_CORFA|nr:Ankyrin repeat-containing domain protein [Cordyceps fumosorosea ARSEF 2679]OAA62180.1 Ankyrin repeat-containing domain protein [Cordyceps fumosorosea ARSEF 2679]
MERLIEQNDEDSKQVIEVIQRYADLSEREPCRRPPSAKDIIKAIFDHKRDETLWLLSQQGIKVSKPDQNGRTVLSYAAERGWTEVVQAALGVGSKINGPDLIGRTAISWASEFGEPTMVKLLISQQASPTLPDHFGRTPLSYAASRGDRAVVDVLLKDIRVETLACDLENKSPLFWASEKGHVEVVTTLLRRRMDRAVIDEQTVGNGLTPLSVALVKNHLEVAELLVAKGASYRHIRIEGLYPLDWAVDCGRWSIVEFLLKCSNKAPEYKVVLERPKTSVVLLLRRNGVFISPASLRSPLLPTTRDGITVAQHDADGNVTEVTEESAPLFLSKGYRLEAYTCSYQCSYLNLSIRDEPTILQELHDSYENALPMRPDVWEAVAWVEDVGKAGKFLELLLHGLKICPDEIPESFIEALLGRDSEAAEQSSIRVMMEMLGERAHGAVRLTPRAWKRAAAGSDNWILAFLRRNWSDSMPKEIQDELSWIEKLRVALRPNSNVPLTKHIEQGLEQYAESGKDYVLLLLATAVRGRMLKATRILAQWPGLDINAPVLPRRRPVLFAARSREIEQVLIDAGAHQDFEDLFGETYKSYRERHPVSNP